MVMKDLYLRKNSNHAGFTLIECILALFILGIICLLFSALVKNTAVVSRILKSEKEKEWHVFVIQLENELLDCEYKEIQDNKIIYRNPKKDRDIWIEYKRGKIVKVENGGYQPLLIGVQHVTFKKEGYFVVITAIFENEKEYTAKWKIGRKSKE
jgi:competence protein ComGF